MGVKLIKCPKAIGYHWHPALSLDQIPNLIRIEKERAKMGLIFYRKHPTLRVKFIIQYTFIHRLLWEILAPAARSDFFTISARARRAANF